MIKRIQGAFPLMALCAMSSMLGVPASQRVAFSPSYFWLTIFIFFFQSISILLLTRSYIGTQYTDGDEFLCGIMSAPVGRLLLGILGILFIFRSAVTLSDQTDCIALYLLEYTPNFAVMLVLLFTAFYVLLPGISRLSGIATLLALILPALIILIAVVGLSSAEPGRLRPLFQPSFSDSFAALVPAALTTSGAECSLLFLGSRNRESGRLKGAAIAPAVCAAVFALLTCTAVCTIGIDGMAVRKFPLVEASRQISLGGIELTERFDLPLLSVSLFTSIMQIAIYSLCASIALDTALGILDRRKTILWLFPVQLAVSLIIQYTDIGIIITSICALGLTAYSLVLFPVLALISFHRFKKSNIRTASPNEKESA